MTSYAGKGKKESVSVWFVTKKSTGEDDLRASVHQWATSLSRYQPTLSSRNAYTLLQPAQN